MTQLQHAIELAEKGFHVFPIVPLTKVPTKDMHFKTQATTDKQKIKEWWSNGHANSNIGISTTNFKESEALIVIDVDQKEGKMGEDELFRLENLEGLELPVTAETKTPSGGRHLFYKTKEPVRQSVSKLAPGIDIRSKGGYVVGPGSILQNGEYVFIDRPIANAPGWLIERCGRAKEKDPTTKNTTGLLVNQEQAISRARVYLENEAPASIKGQAGDQTTFIVAAKIKDFGVEAKTCLDLMLNSSWWERSGSSWQPEKLWVKVRNAYSYGESPVGKDSPEAVFTKVVAPQTVASEDLSPIDKLNKEYAFTVIGGKSVILHEMQDTNGEKITEFLQVEAFRNVHAAKSISFGNKTMPLTQAWLTSDKRRSYKGVCFYPGRYAPNEKLYNLWKGFSVEPQEHSVAGAPQAVEACADFLSHIRENICGGEERLFTWLMNFCAHIIQFPEEKPLVAIVFRGEKGVGKNFFIDQIGYLFRNNYVVTADDRYLIGNFNAHMEQCLLLVLDEAFWSGNKKADGIIKSLITERHHIIERKGRDAYKTTNFSRICILGNADWLIPASNDERRFAVFDVGVGRKQDNKFFSKVRVGMKSGGNRLLMRWLMDFKVDRELVNRAPHTAALQEQKEESLHPVHAWWLECLNSGEIVGADFGGGNWPEEIIQGRFWDAFRRYAKDRNIRSWTASNSGLAKILKKCLTSLDGNGKKMIEGQRFNIYRLPSLEKCQKEWGVWAGSSDTWASSDTISDILN